MHSLCDVMICVSQRGDQQQKHLQRLLQLMTNEGLLMAIKVYCDWIRCNPHIITTCAKVTNINVPRQIPLQADVIYRNQIVSS